MDRRKLLLMLLLEMSHLETIFICTLLVLLMLRAKPRHVERHTLTNRSLVRRGISLCYLNGIIGNTDIECVNELRMDRRTFGILCDLLRQDGRIKADGLVSVEEQVCMTLQILAHHIKNRSIGGRFYRSGETISRYFNSVLQGILRLQGILLKVPQPVPIDSTDPRWRCFKNCLGALDGTHIDVHVPEIDKPRYRTRKGRVATNVLGVCSGDMQFIYVFPGWEGSASDSRVLHDAITRPNGLKVPAGMDNDNNLNAVQEPKGRRRKWEAFEEEALLSVLEDFVARKQRCDTGAFKQGTLIEIAKAVNVLCPNSNIKAAPHIESKLKKWKKTYSLVLDMINTSGFAWNDVKKCVEVDSDDAWQTYVQKNKEADGWRSKPFPLYDRFAYVFGKDRATGNVAETPTEMMEEQSYDPTHASDIGMNQQTQQSTPSENSQRKRKRATGSSSDGTEAIISGLKEFYVESGKRMQMVAEAIVRDTADHSDIAKELRAMGLSPMDQIDALTLILEKPQNVGVFRSIDPELKKVFVQRLLSDKASG